MLLEMEEVGEIKARGTLRQKTKYDSNSLINPDLNEEVTMWLYVRSMSKTSIVTHGWAEQVKNFPFDIYN